MRRNTLGIATMLAMTVGVGGQIERPPLAPDEKPDHPQRSPLYGYYGIPFPNLHHVSRETLNLSPKSKRVLDATGHVGIACAVFSKRDERRLRRKARMRLRKLRGWR